MERRIRSSRALSKRTPEERHENKPPYEPESAAEICPVCTKSKRKHLALLKTELVMCGLWGEQGSARWNRGRASQGTGMWQNHGRVQNTVRSGRSGGPVWPGQKSKGLHHVAEQWRKLERLVGARSCMASRIMLRNLDVEEGGRSLHWIQGHYSHRRGVQKH